MQTRRYRVAFVAVVVAALSLESHFLLAQAKDPLFGHWVLDVSRSTFAAAAPVKRTMQFMAVPNGIRQTITTTTGGLANVTYQLVYTAKFDGHEYPADVASSLDTVSLKRIDARTVERIGKVKGQVAQTETYAVSPDDHTLTVTQEGQNSGVPFKSMQIFVRQ
jgi:hypothetical protein